MVMIIYALNQHSNPITKNFNNIRSKTRNAALLTFACNNYEYITNSIPKKLNKNPRKPNYYKEERETNNTILKELGAPSDGLTSLLNDRIGIIFDGASDIVLIPDLHRPTHRRPQPRHLPLIVPPPK